MACITRNHVLSGHALAERVLGLSDVQGTMEKRYLPVNVLKPEIDTSPLLGGPQSVKAGILRQIRGHKRGSIGAEKWKDSIPLMVEVMHHDPFRGTLGSHLKRATRGRPPPSVPWRIAFW
jgi:hypothetical protein